VTNNAGFAGLGDWFSNTNYVNDGKNIKLKNKISDSRKKKINEIRI
jgi:hypothetical protein